MSDGQADGPTPREIIHDLNNLFAALSGFAQLLVDDLEPGSMPHMMATKILNGQIKAEELVELLSQKLRS